MPFLEDVAQFQASEMGAQAAVRPAPEREVHRLAFEVNLVGVL